jgi:hypothetical protein
MFDGVPQAVVHARRRRRAVGPGPCSHRNNVSSGQRRDDSAAVGEPVDPGRRDGGDGAGGYDPIPIEEAAVGPACGAVPGRQLRVQADLVQVLAGGVDQRGSRSIEQTDWSPSRCEQGGVIAGAGADLQHPTCGTSSRSSTRSRWPPTTRTSRWSTTRRRPAGARPDPAGRQRRRAAGSGRATGAPGPPRTPGSARPIPRRGLAGRPQRPHLRGPLHPAGGRRRGRRPGVHPDPVTRPRRVPRGSAQSASGRSSTTNTPSPASAASSSPHQPSTPAAARN